MYHLYHLNQLCYLIYWKSEKNINRSLALTDNLKSRDASASKNCPILTSPFVYLCSIFVNIKQVSVFLEFPGKVVELGGLRRMAKKSRKKTKALKKKSPEEEKAEIVAILMAKCGKEEEEVNILSDCKKWRKR